MAAVLLEDVDVDIRPVAVDVLVGMPPDSVVKRHQRATELVELYEQRCASLRRTLEQETAVHRSLVQERDNALLARQLQEGIIVRVVCPRCRGSGLKPSDVLSGQIQRKSAFETIGKPVQRIAPMEAPESERCEECGGKRWTLMERYRG